MIIKGPNRGPSFFPQTPSSSGRFSFFVPILETSTPDHHVNIKLVLGLGGGENLDLQPSRMPYLTSISCGTGLPHERQGLLPSLWLLSRYLISHMALNRSKLIDQVSLRDLRRVAKRLFDSKALTFAVVGKPTNLDPTMRAPAYE